MQSALYFAFIRGREGEIQALRALSPLARARMAVVVDLPTVKEGSKKSIEQNLQGGEGQRLCGVNDRTAGAVPAGRGVHAALTAEGLFPGPCKDRRPDAEDPHAG